MRKILYSLLMCLFITSCYPKFYDGEGNKIPIKAVKLLVKSQFTNLRPKEQHIVDIHFYK